MLTLSQADSTQGSLGNGRAGCSHDLQVQADSHGDIHQVIYNSEFIANCPVQNL